MTPTRLVIIALITGLAGGMAVAASGSGTLLEVVEYVAVAGTIWVNAIRMTVIPLVVSLLVVSVASVAEPGALGRMGGRAFLLFLALLSASALLTALIVPPLLGFLPIDPATVATLQAGAAASADATAEGVKRLPGVAQYVVELVPTNPIRAAADGAMLPLVVFALLLGFASTRIPSEPRHSMLQLFTAISEAMMILVRFIISLAPWGVFALMLALGARMGATAAGALGYYVLVICSVLFLQLILLYPVAVLGSGIPLRRFATGLFPAQAVAFSARSSLASLPALIDGADRRLLLPPAVTGFVLPLAVATFKFSAPISFIGGTIFLSHLYGVPVAPLDIAIVAALSVMLSFSVPGIPSGSLVLMAPVLASLGIPVEGIGILIALDVFPDILKTTINVTADMTAAAILGRETPGAPPGQSPGPPPG